MSTEVAAMWFFLDVALIVYNAAFLLPSAVRYNSWGMAAASSVAIAACAMSIYFLPLWRAA